MNFEFLSENGLPQESKDPTAIPTFEAKPLRTAEKESGAGPAEMIFSGRQLHLPTLLE